MTGSTVLAVLLCLNSAVATEKQPMRTLFDFSNPNAAKFWQAVNDGVMGGLSEGDFAIAKRGQLEFTGSLSLENNGGFASVRARSSKLKLKDGDSIVLRVRGDGRTYLLQLYVPTRKIAYSYRSEFKTVKDKWLEVELPLDKFVATWFGREVETAEKVKPPEVTGIGLMLADKQAGPFKLVVEWIKTGMPTKNEIAVSAKPRSKRNEN
ncbi:MAG: CIA30 family protein [Lacipirellulaceae bacterium]